MSTKDAKNSRRYNFGSVDKYLFIGGTAFLSMILDRIRTDRAISVATCKWFLKEPSHLKGVDFESFLKNRSIDFNVFEEIRKNREFARLVGPRTLGISVSAPWIMTADVINLFKRKLVNIHGSDLPLYRGGAGMTWQMLKGDKRGRYTIHFLTERIDEGDILKQGKFDYPRDVVTQSDFQSYKRGKMTEGIISFLGMVERESDFYPKAQPEHLSSYWPRLNTGINGYVNWDWTCNEIVRFINAFSDPFDGAQTFLDGLKVRIKNASMEKSDDHFHPFQAGIIYRKYKKGLYVATREGTLVIRTINDENNKPYFDKVKSGSRLFTPRRYIDESMTRRVYYNSQGLKIKK